MKWVGAFTCWAVITGFGCWAASTVTGVQLDLSFAFGAAVGAGSLIAAAGCYGIAYEQ